MNCIVIGKQCYSQVNYKMGQNTTLVELLYCQGGRVEPGFAQQGQAPRQGMRQQPEVDKCDRFPKVCGKENVFLLKKIENFGVYF